MVGDIAVCMLTRAGASAAKPLIALSLTLRIYIKIVNLKRGWCIGIMSRYIYCTIH